MPMINQYSFMLVGLLLLAIITFLSWRFLGVKVTVPLAGLTFAVLVVFQLAGSTNSNTYSNAEAFDTALTSGGPVLLILYSDF